MFRKLSASIALLLVIFFVTKIALSSVGVKKKDDLFKQVELFASCLSIVQNEYVDEAKPKDLIYNALKGMVSSLDPHSQFLDPETYNELKIDTEGKFGGLGIEITIKDGMLTVITPIEDTPAWKAGIKAQDRIVKINNELTKDISLTDAVKKLRGKPGEAVNITVLRESENKLIDFKITRDVIKIKDIKESKIIEDDIGYIRLVEFRENTLNDFNSAYGKLKKEGMNSLILDLRNNPGGLLDIAEKITEKFIEKGKLILYTKSRDAAQDLKFYARSAEPELNIPIVVLINEGSASGSEILAGCLQDYKRAIIVGAKSFGKGSVQTIIPLSEGCALRLTTSRYFTPSGKLIHGKGITPDIIVEDGLLQEQDKEKQVVPEHLNKPQDIFYELDSKKDEKKDNEKTKKDNQLLRAIDVLKAAKILKNNQK